LILATLLAGYIFAVVELEKWLQRRADARFLASAAIELKKQKGDHGEAAIHF